jgi:hypothetical protein
MRDGETLRTIQRIRVRDGSNVLRTVWQAISAESNRAIVTGTASSASPTAVTTNSATITVVGGIAPFTYAWTVTSFTGGTWSITSATSATTSFACSGVGAGDLYSAELTCTVTDSGGATASVTIEGQAANTYYGYYGGGGPIP